MKGLNSERINEVRRKVFVNVWKQRKRELNKRGRHDKACLHTRRHVVQHVKHFSVNDI